MKYSDMIVNNSSRVMHPIPALKRTDNSNESSGDTNETFASFAGNGKVPSQLW